MNKTVKTIAWICLVLGLLGLAVDVGVYVRGRSMAARFQQAAETGEAPAFRRQVPDAGADNDTNQDDTRNTAPDREGWPQGGGMLDGRRGFNTFSERRAGFPGGMRDGRIGNRGFFLPFLFLAMGPVLAVIGAVILIVNRTPKVNENTDKKDASAKRSTSAKKETEKKK